MREILLVLHIIAAAAWLGGGLSVGFLAPRFQRSGREAARAFYATYESLGKIYFNVAGITVLITGILLVLDGPWAFEDTFVVIGIVIVIIGALVGALFFGPQTGKIVAAYDDDNDAAIGTLTQRFGIVGAIDSLLLIFAVIAMVYKWGV